MSKFLIGSIIYSLVAITALLIYLLIPNEKTIEVNNGTKHIDELNDNLESRKIDENEHEEAGYHYDQDFVDLFRDIENTLEFFVATIKEENVDFFNSMFLPEQFSKDLWEYSDAPYEEKAASQILKEISREGKFVTAKYNTELIDGYLTTREESDIKIILVYNDGQEVNITLDFVKVGTDHLQDGEILFIKNSVLEIVNQVRNQTT